MAGQREHHFVPRFYLRQFSADSKSVSLFNFSQMRAIHGASIRGQCSRRDLYAFAPGLEQAFASLEAEAAEGLRRVCLSGRAPVPGTDDWQVLLGFLGFQKLRTEASGKRSDVSTDFLAKRLADGHPELSDIDLDDYRIGTTDPVALALGQVTNILGLASDLEVHLFKNSTSLPFITSDDPIVLHNQYCEAITYQGVVGWACSGIQAFWPLSPNELLLFYDADVYRVGHLNRDRRETRLVEARDVRCLNLLQILNADQNVYFAPGETQDEIEAHCQTDAESRPAGRTVFVETEEVPLPDGRSSSLIHSYERILPLRLRLDSIAIRPRARKVPLHERSNRYRRDPDDLSKDSVTEDRGPLAERYKVKRVTER